MMDLTKKALPNTVMVGGKAYSVYTDFRLWMRFEIEAGKMQRGDLIDISYLFKNDMPVYCDLTELFVFSRPESPLPRKITHEHDHVIVLDYELDAELIYAAFLGQYGIDLYEADLHWHKFLALLAGLNESTRLREIMGYRCYKKSEERRDPYEELRRAWEIEPPVSAEEQAEIDEFSKMFGGWLKGRRKLNL